MDSPVRNFRHFRCLGDFPVLFPQCLFYRASASSAGGSVFSWRFVKPGVVQREEPPRHADNADVDHKGSGGDEPPGLHPFVQGLLRELPKAGDVWPESQRKLWLDTAGSIFKMIYKDKPDTNDVMK